MTMTGEDILHQNSTLDRGTLGAIAGVYDYLPRIGEFFQRTVIQLYDYQTDDLNANVLMRVFDAILCFPYISDYDGLFGA